MFFEAARQKHYFVRDTHNLIEFYRYCCV